jgi:hypothetical protein
MQLTSVVDLVRTSISACMCGEVPLPIACYRMLVASIVPRLSMLVNDHSSQVHILRV